MLSSSAAIQKLTRSLSNSIPLVLVILDRNLDLFPMFSHSWTYQALVNDVLGMKLNRVSVEVRSSPLHFYSISGSLLADILQLTAVLLPLGSRRWSFAEEGL
jgi:hypothetical protein